MLMIRIEQMTVFESAIMRKYEDRVLRTIAKTYPKRYEEDGEDLMRVLVQAGVRKGELYGITADDDVERYILVLVEHGVDFEQQEGMKEYQEILEKKDLPGDAKVNLLCRRLSNDSRVSHGAEQTRS